MLGCDRNLVRRPQGALRGVLRGKPVREACGDPRERRPWESSEESLWEVGGERKGVLRGACTGIWKDSERSFEGNPGEWGAVVVADLRTTKDLMN